MSATSFSTDPSVQTSRLAETPLPPAAGLSAVATLQDILARRRQTYANEPNLILEDFRNEVGTTESYNGRQLLELLQNADDAARDQREGPRKLLLRLTENALLVANTGAHFTGKGVRSLLYANLSAKYGEKGLIGEKGLGFRALLSWSQCISIDSGELHLEFSARVAHAFADELRSQSELVRQTLAEDENPHPIALLRWPAEYPAPSELRMAGYDTTITLDLREMPGLVGKVQAQLQALVPEVLVFLQHLDEVIIESPAGSHTLHCTGRGTDAIRAWGIGPAREWRVFAHTTHFKGKDYALKAAWNPEWAQQGNRSWLHTFLATKVALPFPLLVHGPFQLTSNRDNFVNDEPGLNRHLLTQLAPFLVRVALDLRATAAADVFLPLRLLWDKGAPLQHGLSDFDFASELRPHLRAAALLPRLDGSYGDIAGTFHTDLPFARYLSARDCPDVMTAPSTATDTAALAGVLRQMAAAPQPLDLPALLPRIAAAQGVVPFTDYARLLELLVLKINTDRVALPVNDLPALFTGSDGEKLAATAALPVFLPPDESGGPSTRQLSVRLMAEEQAAALREAFEVETFAELAAELSELHLRAYSFTELARALLEACATHQPRNLHREFFRFFQAEYKRLGNKMPAPRPDGLQVLLPTLGTVGKVSQVRCGSELYFGRAYEMPLCEGLYYYRIQERIVAAPAALGLKDKALPQVVAYLRWCGVADEPRILVRKLEATEHPYMDYVLRRFEYRRERLGDARPGSFAELAGYQTGTCQITSVDDLSNILRRSKHLSTILAWVRGAGGIRAELSRRAEPDSNSLQVCYGGMTKWRSVSGGQMASFIAWQFMTTPWLKAEDWRERVAPQQTVLSPTITAEFRPHLFRLPTKEVRLPSYEGLFGSYAGYKETLLKVGIRESIETVDVGLIYKVLAALPSVDPSGRAARSIYRELAENFAWKPEYGEHESYQHFLTKGTVWCRAATGESYQPVKSAFYLPTLDHGPTLQGLFSLLAIAPGYDPWNIQELFGVAPLPALTLHLAKPEPRPHPLQSRFNEDWYHLLPYLYAFRKDKSTRDDNLSRLQELRINLCATLPVIYQDSTTSHNLEIEPFRFLFPGTGNRRTAWLRVPATITSLEQLQQEADACEAVAQLVCTALGATVDKAHYDMLFAASRTKRDGILRNKLPGQGLAGLEEARRQLAYTSRAAQAFWTQFMYATGTRKKTRLPATTVAWRPWLLERFPTADAQLQSVLSDTDWENMGSTETMMADELAPLWALFGAVDLEPTKFNAVGPGRLDFTPLLVRGLEQKRDDFRPQFAAALRAWLQPKGAGSQSQFLAIFQRYQAFFPPVAVTIKLSLVKAWTKAVCTEFELPSDWHAHSLFPESPAETNRQLLLAYGEAQGIPTSFILSFLQSDEQQSLLHFDQLPLVKAALSKAYKPPVPPPPGTSTAVTDKVVKLGTLTFRYGSKASLREQLEKLTRTVEPIAALKPRRPVAVSEKNMPPYRGGRLGSNGAAHAEKGDQTGFIGELFAYWRLCDLYGAANVVWESSYAQEAGLSTEINDQAGYDMRYRRAEEQEWHRVEVKSGWEDGQLTDFNLSAGELKAGRYWGKAYQLLLVSGVSLGPAGAGFACVDAPFVFKGNRSFLDNPYFQVTTRNYHLRFNS